MDLRDYLNILFRHTYVIAFVFALSFSSVFIFIEKSPDLYTEKLELSIRPAEIYIQTTPTHLIIPSYNNQMLNNILRSDDYYNDIHKKVSENMPGVFGETSPEDFRRTVIFELEETSPGSQINTVILSTTTHKKEYNEKLLEISVEILEVKITNQAKDKNRRQQNKLHDLLVKEQA
ncbi:hypothetical protein ACFL54_09310, partial [Planctomycetota bacterium]